MLLLLGGVSKALQACGWAGAAGSVSFCWALVGRGHDCSRGHSWRVTVEKGREPWEAVVAAGTQKGVVTAGGSRY